MSARDTFTWLALDASLRAFGWALFVDDGEVHSCQLYRAGVWETERDPKLKPTKTASGKKKKPPGVMKDNARRMNEIGEQLAKLVQSEHPVAIFIEALATPFAAPPKPGEPRARGTSLVTVQALGRIRGIVDGIALVLGVPVFEVGSQAIKLAMAGTRDAPKEEVGRRVIQLYPAVRNFLPVGEIDDNVTDAVACGHIGESHEIIARHRGRRAAGGQDDLFDAASPCGVDLPSARPPDWRDTHCEISGASLVPAKKSMAEQLDEQLEKKRRAEETPAQRIERLATPALVKAPAGLLVTTSTPARPPKGNRGQLTTGPVRNPNPPALELPTAEQLAGYWKADE